MEPISFEVGAGELFANEMIKVGSGVPALILIDSAQTYKS
jgi:hypothetical protein